MNAKLSSPKFSSLVRIAGVAGLALWAAVAAAATPVPRGAEVSLPQARARITDWALDGHKGLWVEAIGGQWYHAEFLGPCIGGATVDNIALRFNPDGSFDRFSQIVVPRSHLVCPVKSFVTSGEPGATVHTQEPRA